MGARGRRGLIVGLEDLAKGVVLASEMKRRALSDALERERFEFEKTLRDAQLAEESEYHEGLIRNKKSEMGAKAREAAQKQRAALSESIHRGRVTKNLESGNLTRAARIAYNRGLALPEHTMELYAPKDAARETELDFYKRDPEGYSKYRSAGRAPEKMPSDIYEDVKDLSARIAQDRGAGLPASPMFVPEATRYIRGADNLPLPKVAASDAYESMSSEEWDDVVQSAVEDALGHPLTEEDAANPLITTLRVTDPRHRRQILAGIPKMFIYTRLK